MDIARLETAAGRDLLGIADRLLDDDPARATIALRRHTDDAALASAALTQARLRRDAAGKFGADADRMWFTRDGLEQASRDVVAARRAERIAASGADRVADLCCGIGADAIALARNGLRVLAVDHDPATAGIATANAAALGLTDRIDVRCADALDTDLSGMSAGFADPARRANGRRIFDPQRYSPPLSEVWQAMADLPGRVCKVGPGIDHAAIPPGTEAEWVSVDGSVVEAALWQGNLARVPRRATVRHGTDGTELTGDGVRSAPVGSIGDYVYEPDGAVIRAHLVAELAERLDARLAHPAIAYLYADTHTPTPLARCWRVVETMPFQVKRLREVVRQRRIGRLTVKKRGADVDPDRLRRDLKPSGGNEATLIVTRVGDRHTAVWCEPV